MSKYQLAKHIGYIQHILGVFRGNVTSIKRYVKKPNRTSQINMCPEINTLIKEPLQFRRLKCLVSHTLLVVCITAKFTGG